MSLTKKQALGVARELLGPTAFVEYVRGAKASRPAGIAPPCRVGQVTPAGLLIRGAGESWEEALDRARRSLAGETASPQQPPS